MNSTDSAASFFKTHLFRFLSAPGITRFSYFTRWALVCYLGLLVLVYAIWLIARFRFLYARVGFWRAVELFSLGERQLRTLPELRLLGRARGVGLLRGQERGETGQKRRRRRRETGQELKGKDLEKGGQR
jgi:hypothetical protein